ncbi:MAG: glycoside hydrolase family 2 [Lachnospiraceae bacterium]|nr:glycoside hydrolase family 2 [Lachnospiraceae bacterium]
MTSRTSNEIGWKKHPRPQLRRGLFHMISEGWSLNGGDICVPFPPQAPRSGYEGDIGTRLCYEVSFVLPESFVKERILLHFGAVDQVAEVWVNDHCVGTHEGGYLPFSFDITEVVYPTGENKLTVKVTDELSKQYPYGKQSKTPGGMWYTEVSGIWQTVWLENVPERYIGKVRFTPDEEGVGVTVFEGALRKTEAPASEQTACEGKAEKGFSVIIDLGDGETLTETFEHEEGYIRLAGRCSDSGMPVTPKLWSPESPYLYSAKIIAGEDEAETYFALRTMKQENTEGRPRLTLNGKPVFLHGLLDQGYFPEGIYLPCREEAYEADILRVKELGFNMLRKHCKVEPEWFYYYCDVHGMLVLQDIVNSGGYSFAGDTALPTIGLQKRKDTKRAKTEEETSRRRFFEQHMKDTLHHLYNHPCVVGFTIFNEGWGQFEADRMYEIAKREDGSRLYDTTSGWFAQKKSDFDSRHVYFRTKKLTGKEKPLFLSECGGFSYQIKDHCYSPDKSYGYGACGSEEELTERICSMYRKMVLPAIERGLCGCVYTQVSDVEEEINGLYTYDRQVCKVNKDKMKRLAAELTGALLKASR